MFWQALREITLSVCCRCQEEPEWKGPVVEIAWRWNRLSPTEKQVAELLLEGKSNKGICEEVFLSRARVQECIKRIVIKTGAESTRGAITLLAEERENAALLRVLEQATDGVAIVQDGVVKFGNRALTKMVGYTPEEMAGMSILELLAPELRDEYREKYERRVRGEQFPIKYQTTIVCKGGRRKDIRVASVGFLRYNGRPAIMVVAFEKG